MKYSKHTLLVGADGELHLDCIHCVDCMCWCSVRVYRGTRVVVVMGVVW